MFSIWHNTILGAYSPEDRWLGLDYTSLLADPLQTKLTIYHEQTHYILCKDTDFGQAIEAIYQFLPLFKHISKNDKEQLKRAFSKNQLFVQEGTASLMEVLHLKRFKGKKFALDWARKNFPSVYYQRLEKLLFVLEMSDKYADFLTMKIPHTALHTGIRKKIVELDLLSDVSKFVSYLNNSDNNPDARYSKMIEVLKLKNYLVTKPEKEICDEANIAFTPDIPKEDVSNFLTYLSKFTDNPRTFIPSEIGNPREVQETLNMSFEDMFVANMNMNLGGGDVLWNFKDLLHYQKEIKAVLVNRFDPNAEWKSELELLTGRKHDAGIIAYLSTGERLLIGMGFDEASALTQSEFRDKTLLVKWGLYKPGLKELLYFPKSRIPNVTIYNSVKHLKENFEQYFKHGNKAEYIYIAIKDNSFFTLVLKDKNDVLHWINTFGNKFLNEFLANNKNNLLKVGSKKFLQDHTHFNNVLCVWNGMPWNIDWYEQFQDMN